MQIKHLKVEVTLEFDTVQTGETNLSDLSKIIKEGMKETIPPGCTIKCVDIRETKTEEVDYNEFMKRMEEEYKKTVDRNTDDTVNKILNSVKEKENKE